MEPKIVMWAFLVGNHLLAAKTDPNARGQIQIVLTKLGRLFAKTVFFTVIKPAGSASASDFGQQLGTKNLIDL